MPPEQETPAASPIGRDTPRVEGPQKVTGTAPLLETETSTSGQVLEGDTIEKIPVLQKAFYRIYLYMPGMNIINGQHAVGQRQRYDARIRACHRFSQPRAQHAHVGQHLAATGRAGQRCADDRADVRLGTIGNRCRRA